MRGRAYRRTMKKQKDRRLRDIITHCGYIPHAGYIEYDFVDDILQPVGKYIKYPKNSNAQKFLKRQTSHKVRKSDIFGKGNSYRKCLEYWWEMY